MILLLRTVRAKLVSLVVATALASLLAVAVLSIMMQRQLIDQIDDRLPEAARGFETELADDLRDLDSIARELAKRTLVADALRRNDETAAREAARQMRRSHPDVDILLLDATGALVAKDGVAGAHDSSGSVPITKKLQNGSFRGVVREACEVGALKRIPPPTYVIARPVVGGAGVVVTCLPIDGSFLKNAAAKLGVEIGIVDPELGARRPTGHFPRALSAAATERPTMREQGGLTWALYRFVPERLRGAARAYTVVLALDVTRIRGILNENLAWALAIMSFAALLALLFGVRVARLMSNGISRVSNAFARLEKQDYSHVEPVRTGDEIERLAVIFNSMVDRLKERDKLRATLGKYMTQTVMDHLLKGRLELGGETRVVTILFCDIRGFTSISERMGAQSLVKLLNEFFTAMVTILMEEDAVVDKYIGDAIMAVFGAPISKPDDPLRAVRAAVRMRDALTSLNADLATRGIPEMRMGIGIHTGEVVAGNIGSNARMEYTVIGDAVNLASRLESATKDLDASILVSEDTYALVRDQVSAVERGELPIRGRDRPVLAYEVTGLV
jgi:adenylate cyclase